MFKSSFIFVLTVYYIFKVRHFYYYNFKFFFNKVTKKFSDSKRHDEVKLCDGKHLVVVFNELQILREQLNITKCHDLDISHCNIGLLNRKDVESRFKDGQTLELHEIMQLIMDELKRSNKCIESILNNHEVGKE